MTLLSPWIAALAAGITIPALLLLYVLKLRRRHLPIASTLLWHQAHEDLQANVPFRRLRLTGLFLLQLLVLLLLTLALGDPVLESGAPMAARSIIVIDRSASMQSLMTSDAAARTRLDEAKETAAELVAQLLRDRRGSAVMVITFASTPEIVHAFDGREKVLLEAIDAIQPVDETAHLESALRLADTFAARGETAEEAAPDVILLSDGGVEPPRRPEGFRLRAGRFRYVAMGLTEEAPRPNVGIVALSARRDYREPERVLLFTRLASTSAPAEVLLTITVDGRAATVRRVAFSDDISDARPSEVAETFEFIAPRRAIIALEITAPDALGVDDRAALVVPPPLRPRIALVFGEAGVDPYLEELLVQAEPSALRTLKLDDLDLLDPVEVDTAALFDLMVFDRVTPSRLLAVPTLTFGAALPGVELRPLTRTGGQRILGWSRQHPLMRHVNLDPVIFSGAGAFELPAGAAELATSAEGPVIVEVDARGAAHVGVAFPLARSNWPADVSVAVFLQNIFDSITTTGGGAGRQYRPGDAIVGRAAADVRELVVRDDEGAELARVAAAPGEPVALPVLRRVGRYTVNGAVPPDDEIALNLLSDTESDNRIRPAIDVNAERVTASATREAAPRRLWPYLAGLAFGVSMLEWIVYGLRAGTRGPSRRRIAESAKLRTLSSFPTEPSEEAP